MVRGRRNPLYYGLPERLKATRQRAGLARRPLDELAGLANGVVQRVEDGESVPLIDTLERLALALGVPAGWLAYGHLGRRPFQDKVPPAEQEHEPPQPAPRRLAPDVKLSAASVGARLRRARGERSRNALGQESGVSGQSIANIEQKGRMPGVDTAEQIAGALGVAVGWLAYEQGDEPATDA